VTTYSGSNVQRTEDWVYTTDNSAATNRLTVTHVSTDGLRSWHAVYRDGSTPVVTQTRTVFAGNGNRYVTNTSPDGSYVVSAYAYGRMASVTRRNSSHDQLRQTSYGYDAHGRQATVTDARNGTTTFAYNAADLITSLTTPAPGTGQPAQTTLTHHNPMLQATNIVQPDGSSLTNEYYPTGLLRRAHGSRNYPVGYGYDAQGRMTRMTNWTGFASGAGSRVTAWDYANRAIGVGPEQCVASKQVADFVIDTEPCYSRFSCPFPGSKQPISLRLR
jgi:YD repeat-containing protein